MSLSRASKSLAASALFAVATSLSLHTGAVAAPQTTFVDVDDFSSNAAYSTFYQQKLTWSQSTCDPDDAKVGDVDLECTKMIAPKDWQDPSKGTVSIGMARRVEDKPEGKRLLLSNPGGPGVPGLKFGAWSLAYTVLPLKESHHTVGIDVRGVGSSTRVECDLSKVPWEEDFYSDGDGRTYTPEQIQAAARNQKSYNEVCQEQSKDLSPYISNNQTARDFNLARAVMGFQHSDYYGVSAGTRLGSIMAKLFPSKFDRVILEGVDGFDKPSQAEVYKHKVRTTQQSVDRYVFPFIARHHDVYQLGKTTAEVNASYEKIRAHLVTTGRANDFDYDLYRKQFAADGAHLVGVALQRELAAQSSSSPTPTPSTEPRKARSEMVNLTYRSVNCNGYTEDVDPTAWFKEVESLRNTLPALGFMLGAPECHGWKPVGDTPPELLARPIKQALLYQQEADPATTYQRAREARMNTNGNVKMLFLDDFGGHGGSHRISACAKRTISDYMLKGIFPANDVACQAPPLKIKGVDVNGKAITVEDSSVYEFGNAATASAPLPKPQLYVQRNMTAPKVDSTKPGYITPEPAGDRRATSVDAVQPTEMERLVAEGNLLPMPFTRR